MKRYNIVYNSVLKKYVYFEGLERSKQHNRLDLIESEVFLQLKKIKRENKKGNLVLKEMPDNLESRIIAFFKKSKIVIKKD